MGAEVSNQAVCNCGPLIALAGINHLGLLPNAAFAEVEHRVVGSLANTDVITTNTFFISVYPGLTEEMIQHVLATFDQFVAGKAAG